MKRIIIVTTDGYWCKDKDVGTAAARLRKDGAHGKALVTVFGGPDEAALYESIEIRAFGQLLYPPALEIVAQFRLKTLNAILP